MSMGRYQTPGVYRQDIFERSPAELRTGVPVFLGRAAKDAANPIQALTLWPQFSDQFGAPLADSYLGVAVRGFFTNGGQLCYVVRLADGTPQALAQALAQIAPFEGIDLVCAPDIMCPAEPGQALDPDRVAVMQRAVLDHCAQLGDRFAILDARPGLGATEVLAQRGGLSDPNGALYYPWIVIAESANASARLVPPCGHVAGIYARSDRAVGVHKAPANEVVQEAIDLEVNLNNADQAGLNPAGVNCIRSIPGRGIRIWGARTLGQDPAWMYISVRRLFLTAGRWIQHNMVDTVFEPNDPQLWARIGRELNAYFKRLFERGALKGGTPQEAFYIKCDADTNPLEVRNLGQVVTEIGLAPSLPNEFIVVRIIHGASGVTIAGPNLP